jgi:serine/threonine protein kinase/tetratricopeptide (TPR) repeat protein
MDDSRSRPDEKSASKKPAPPGVRAPFAGESSSNVPVPPQDQATIIDAGPSRHDPDATIIDAGPRFDPDATLIDADPDATIAPGTSFRRTPPPARTPSPSPSQLSGSYASAAVFQIGDMLGGRYEILLLLGEGGMGAVYKAADRELDRFVALKVIRPELASNPSILARFKQELLLAHQVTHRNVIRIYDLGEAEGVKFITMEFIEGKDLRSIIREKQKFAPEEAVEVIQQVCQALDAAHTVGVIHRDLKPQNIMQDPAGRILVMDFGLARTLEGDGMTQTGAIVGTMEYMSPEQALAKDLDQRSDLFALGLILYEMLTGKTPFQAESALASLIKRTQERATPVSDIDNQIPGALSGIVSKCLERDLNERYQSAAAILADLNTWKDKRAAGTIKFDASVKPWGQTLPWPLITGVVTALALASSGYVLRDRLFHSAPSAKSAPVGPSVSLAILPFRNASGDPSVDWLGSSLAEMLSTDVGQSARLRTISPERLHQVLSDLHITPGTSIDPTMVGRIAEFSNADTMVWGQYAKFGGQIRIDATLQDLKHDRSVPIKIEGVDEKDIPGAVDRLAASIRNNLAFSPDVINELKASSFQPSSKSVPALRDFGQGVQLLRDNKNLDAVKMLQAAIQEDPQFALAYSRLAEANFALGYDTQAEQASRKALELSQQLPLAEKYLIEANHAYIMKDSKKAIAAYENLAKTFPDNADVEYTLGRLYASNGEYDKARAQFASILKADPNNIKALWQIGSVEWERGNPQAALEPLSKGVSLAVQVGNQEQKALILQALGISYRMMDKPDEAIRSIQDSMEISRKLGMKRLLANSLSELALDQIATGKPDAAMTNYDQALEILKEIGEKGDYGSVLLNRALLYYTRGDLDKSLQGYKDALQIQRDMGDLDGQALCLSNIADVYFRKFDTDNALIYYQQSLQLRQKLNQPVELALTLSSLGDLYTAMGDYDQALANLMNALDISRKANDTKGAALASQSIGRILMYQGRLGPAVGAMQDSVNGYRSTNNKSAELAESLNDLADTLTLVGRGNESGKLLDEATKVASELRNESIHSEVLNTQGDEAFYRGDYKAARSAYEQAAQAATKTKDREKILIAKANLARIPIAEGRAQGAIPELRAVVQEAESTHSKYYWLRASVDLAEAMIKSKDYAHARQELDQALNTSEKLGTRLLTAIIHFQLGNLMKQTGDTLEAASQYRQASTLLDEIKKEQGAEHILERTDLKVMYIESTQGAQPAKS